MSAIYSALDVFLLTSRTENIPNVLIEAQAAGVPTVSPDVGGVSETMSDGATGYLVRERSAGGLAAAVLRVLNQGHVLAEGPAWVAKRFAHDRMVRATLGVCRQEAARARFNCASQSD